MSSVVTPLYRPGVVQELPRAAMFAALARAPDIFVYKVNLRRLVLKLLTSLRPRFVLFTSLLADHLRKSRALSGSNLPTRIL